VRLAYQEPQATKSSALKREAAIKALTRTQKLRLVTGAAARGH
jgi:predicted GIY-YIG superfamily endonuclease